MPSDPPHISPAAAHYVIERMLRERRISERDVEQCLAGMRSEIAAIEERLAKLRALAGTPKASTKTKATQKHPAAAPVARKRRKIVSPLRRLHGSYIGYLRQFSERERSKYKKLAAEQGKQAAIDSMKAALGK
jgi:hypothetical protein